MWLNDSLQKYLINPFTPNNLLVVVNLSCQSRKHIIILKLALIQSNGRVALPLEPRHSDLPSLLRAFGQTHDLFDNVGFVGSLIQCCLEEFTQAELSVLLLQTRFLGGLR